MQKKTGDASNRIKKFNSELKREISDIIYRKLKNPAISGIVSVMDVDTSKDLSHAKVYISVFATDESKKKATIDAIIEDAKKIRKELSDVVRARTVPELHVIVDGSMEYGDKMDKLFIKISEGEKS